MRPVVFLVVGLLLFTGLFLLRGTLLQGSGTSIGDQSGTFAEVATALDIEPMEKDVQVEPEGEYDFFATVGNLARQVAGLEPPEDTSDLDLAAGGSDEGLAEDGESTLAGADPATIIPKPRPEPAGQASSRLDEKVELTDGNIHANLDLFVGELQKKLPMKIDASTTLEKVLVADLNVTYYYTLSVQSDRIDKKRFKEKLHSQITSQLCKEKNLRKLGEFGVTYTYVYYDNRRRPIYRFLIDPTECTA